MKQLELELKTTQGKKLEKTRIGKTPFVYIKENDKKFITCGKVILETELEYEDAEIWVKTKNWEAISLLVQSIINEVINSK